MTDRWRDVFVAAGFGAALVLLLHVAAGCGDGDRAPSADGAVADVAAADVATESDAPGMDAGVLSDAAPPSDASAPDGAATD